jgi:hypothetical protein
VTGPAPQLDTSAREALCDLIIEHAWLLDHGRWHDVAALYVEDGTLSMGPNVLRGRTELLAWADRRAANTARHTRHQCTNVRLRSDDANTATGTVMLVLHVSDGGAANVEFVGEYRDRYLLDDNGRWRFRDRALHPLGVSANDTPGGNDA